MEKPRSISSGEAMRWNEDVNRRRLEHHERRCAEDAMYRKAYEYLIAEERLMWEQMHKPFAEAMAAEVELRSQFMKTKDGKEVFVPVSCPCHQMPESVEHQTVNDCMKDADKPQRVKTHEEVLQERAAVEAFQQKSEIERLAAGGNVLAIAAIAMMFDDPEAMKRHIEELRAMKPYLDEIRETDKRFRNEEIKHSGFEW
jgi:hypothetical protein